MAHLFATLANPAFLRRIRQRRSGRRASGREAPYVRKSIPGKSSLRRTLVQAVGAFARFLRRIWQFLSRPGDESSGLEYAWKPVPRGPSPTHHLVGAKALPPLDKTYLFAKD